MDKGCNCRSQFKRDEKILLSTRTRWFTLGRETLVKISRRTTCSFPSSASVFESFQPLPISVKVSGCCWRDTSTVEPRKSAKLLFQSGGTDFIGPDAHHQEFGKQVSLLDVTRASEIYLPVRTRFLLLSVFIIFRDRRVVGNFREESSFFIIESMVRWKEGGRNLVAVARAMLRDGEGRF